MTRMSHPMLDMTSATGKAGHNTASFLDTITPLSAIASTPSQHPGKTRQGVWEKAGRSLEPGDGVWVGANFTGTWAVHVGNGKLVACEKTGRRVKMREVPVGQPFGKLNIGGICPAYSKSDRVARAKSYIGKIFIDGDGLMADFLSWVFTGMKYIKAWARGFDVRVRYEVGTARSIDGQGPERHIGCDPRETPFNLRVPETDTQSLAECNVPPVFPRYVRTPRNLPAVTGSVLVKTGGELEARDKKRGLWCKVHVLGEREDKVHVRGKLEGKEFTEEIPKSRLRPLQTQKKKNVIGTYVETRDNITGVWYKGKVTDENSSKVRIHLTRNGVETDDWVRKCLLRPHQPKFLPDTRVLARKIPPRLSLHEARTVSCEGEVATLRYKDGEVRKLQEKYAFDVLDM